ncbi:MAG TPA: hypothetical protein VG755_14180 [Nannocystaceae bacterium]|nr:hypothetical protein [Nannocystaceae bacterium]
MGSHRRDESALLLAMLSSACFGQPPRVDALDETSSSSSGTLASSSSTGSDEGGSTAASSEVTSAGSTSADESSEADSGSSSETDSPPGTIGPLFPIADNDDGAIFPDGSGYGAHWYPSGEMNTAGLQYMGEFPHGYRYYAFLRFELPEAIAADAVIEDAKLVLFGHDAYDWQATDALRVWAQHSDDAPQVGGVQHYPGASIVLGDASVRWPEALGLAWVHPGPNETPNLAPVLQQLVDEYGGLAEGAHVQLWVGLDALDDVGEEVGWLDSIAGRDTAPRLTILVRPSA